MTVAEISSQVCGTVGQNDATSVNQCNAFVNARHKMIADSYPWKDLEVTTSVVLDAADNEIDLPTSPAMDRVIAIRADTDNFLDPVEANLLIQTDPTIFERTGPPTVYQEGKDPTSGTKTIKVYPTPTVDVTLFIVGKRTVPDLSPTDSPILRNIDNCLIAYALGDMLRRQRQYAKANEVFTEAAAMLEAAKALETAQGNSPRRSKYLTVAGNSLAEMTDAVCARTGQWSLDSVVLVKEFLRRNYQQVYDSFFWSESSVIASVNSDGEQIILPDYFDRIKEVRADSSLAALVPADIGLLFGLNPQVFENSGSACSFSYLTPVAAKQLSTARERLSIVSSNSGDKSPVFIKGESAGVELSESVNLNGTTAVQTANTYDVPLTIAKGITIGDVVVTGATTATDFQRILASERERKHMRIWLQPRPGTVQECLVLGKRRIKPLVQDEDTPLLRDIGNVLINLACSDMFSKLKDAKGAADAKSKADNALATLINLETQQGASGQRVIPYVEPCYDPISDGAEWFVAK